jgi:hypothetical protein
MKANRLNKGLYEWVIRSSPSATLQSCPHSKVRVINVKKQKKLSGVNCIVNHLQTVECKDCYREVEIVKPINEKNRKIIELYV